MLKCLLLIQSSAIDTVPTALCPMANEVATIHGTKKFTKIQRAKEDKRRISCQEEEWVKDTPMISNNQLLRWC